MLSRCHPYPRESEYLDNTKENKNKNSYETVSRINYEMNILFRLSIKKSYFFIVIMGWVGLICLRDAVSQKTYSKDTLDNKLFKIVLILLW